MKKEKQGFGQIRMGHSASLHLLRFFFQEIRRMTKIKTSKNCFTVFVHKNQKLST